VKFISELASKELTRVVLLTSDAAFKNLMKNSLFKYEEMLREPEKIARERVSLRNRKKVLQ